ncbi:zinc finger matrin-type protein 1 [Leuresthes tenuis]|uniref:zinc finger matrin-type protein 1 n=1 Tax=Leuresthes tenuis TaxID=355514 RepID=UPI003B50576B
MEDERVCLPLTAESDAQNNTTSSRNVASVIDADTMINTKIGSTQVEGGQSDEELLKGLLTDNYCHVCCSKLLVESHRMSHYEGKRHAQKVRVYLKAVRAEKTTGSHQPMPNDKNRFCELCNMVFSSHVVAKSHYEGKVHAKNLRKQSLHPPGKDTEAHTKDPDNFDQKSPPEGDMELRLNPAASPASPNKYCSLCAASFNSRQMALQHYNGRKHQRNQARQELLKELGDDLQQANSLMCQMCGVQLNSVEMYQAHMQGNKHQIREKKVSDLFKSQPNAYSTFADELADYIQVQKVRGITPRTNHPHDGTQGEDGDEEEKNQEAFEKWDVVDANQAVLNVSCNLKPSHQPHPGTWHGSFPGPPWPSHGWDNNCPPPLPPCSGSSHFPSQPTKSGRYRRLSSSSTYSTSSSASCSSDSTHTSDSDDSAYRHREKRRVRKCKRDRSRRGGDEESGKEEGRKKRRRRGDYDSGERRREESVESEEEGKSKKLKSHVHQRHKEKKCQPENFEADRGERLTDTLKPEHVIGNREENDLHSHSESGHDKSAKPKFKKEKKKAKDKVDTRTEEEKLWDDSILGC